MNKPLLLLAIATSALFAPPLQAQAEITAPDIARHLGIRFWKIPAGDLPDYFSVHLIEVRDGKAAGVYTEGFSSQKEGDLTISVTTDRDGTCAATVAIGDTFLRTSSKNQRQIGGTGAVGGFSPVLLNVPMVLMADYKARDGVAVISQKMDDVISGLAVVITPKEKE